MELIKSMGTTAKEAYFHKRERFHRSAGILRENRLSFWFKQCHYSAFKYPHEKSRQK